MSPMPAAASKASAIAHPLTAAKQVTARKTLSSVPVLQVFLDFRRVVRDPHFTAMAGNDKHAWWVITHEPMQAALFPARQFPSSSCCTCRAQLFMGAAGSAFFAGAPPGPHHGSALPCCCPRHCLLYLPQADSCSCRLQWFSSSSLLSVR